MRFTGVCPECGAKVSRFHKLDFGERFKGYRCRNGHVITVMDGSEVISIKYPLQHLEACPKCGRRLKLVSTHGFDEEDGVYQLDTYICEAGHWIPHRQLVVRKISLAAQSGGR